MSPRTWFILPQRQVIKRARREWPGSSYLAQFNLGACLYCLCVHVLSAGKHCLFASHSASHPISRLTADNSQIRAYRARAQRSTAQHTGPNQTLQRAGQGQLSSAFGITTSERKKRGPGYELYSSAGRESTAQLSARPRPSRGSPQPNGFLATLAAVDVGASGKKKTCFWCMLLSPPRRIL